MADQKKLTVKWFDLEIAFEQVSSGGMGENQAYLSKETGEFFFESSYSDEELPDDIEDEPDKYIEIPDKRELGLGKRLAIAFAEDCLPADVSKVRQMFSRSGAYARFRDLLEHRRAVERWHEYEDEATERALRAWCEDNGIEIVNPPGEAVRKTTTKNKTPAEPAGNNKAHPPPQAVASDAVLDAGRMTLVRATRDDLPFIMKTERTPAYEDLLGRSEQAQHLAFMADRHYAYFVARIGGKPVGFAIVRDWASPNQVALIKRIAVTHPGHGHGRALLTLLVDAIFRETSAHRVWIGLFPENLRARRAYETVGFRPEGVARGNVLFRGTHRDEMIMAILRPEWPGGKGRV